MIASMKTKAESVSSDEINEMIHTEEKKYNEKARLDQKKAFTEHGSENIPVPLQFPEANWPMGELCAYQDFRRVRFTDEECREREKAKEFEKTLKDAREAAEVHRQARAWLRREAKPGRKYG